jgi:P-type E1-E2 ATPase
VDGVLLSARADFDSSYLTGESHSIVKHRGMPVEAGAVLLSAEAVIDVKAVGLQTEFGKLIRKVQENSTQKTELQNLSDRWSQILLISVYGLAVVYLALNWRISPEVSVERALALIILACPCAMAFGTPLALSFSMRNAFRKGFLFKSGDVFEKIQKVKNIFFDKTGTLTGRNMTVVATRPEQISAELEQIVLSLEAISKHPIAEALRIYFAKGTLQTLDITNAMEVPGSGLLGEYKGRHFCMRSSEQITGRKSVALYENAEPLVHFFLQDSLLVPSRQLVTELVNKGYKVSVLSGDSENEVKKIADALEIPASQCFARMTAQKKSEKVAAVPNSLMIGDGANDSLAFQNADVGIAVAGSVELALKSADIYLLSADLSKIAELFDISRRALFLIRQNLAISLVYNSFGAAAALMGYINPFVAALLMPVSSGFILLSSWWGSRD